MKKKAILFLALGMTASGFMACKKTTAFSYKASCSTACKVSYYDSDGNFVARSGFGTSFEQDIAALEFQPVQVAVQSSVCPETGACDSSLFLNDEIRVELWKGDEKICEQSTSGKPLQAVSCKYKWEQ
ncbi:MAG: hypothetical protein ACT6QS_11590 [Flavobacteriales bacterium]